MGNGIARNNVRELWFAVQVHPRLVYLSLFLVCHNKHNTTLGCIRCLNTRMESSSRVGI